MFTVTPLHPPPEDIPTPPEPAKKPRKKGVIYRRPVSHSDTKELTNAFRTCIIGDFEHPNDDDDEEEPDNSPPDTVHWDTDLSQALSLLAASRGHQPPTRDNTDDDSDAYSSLPSLVSRTGSLASDRDTSADDSEDTEDDDEGQSDDDTEQEDTDDPATLDHSWDDDDDDNADGGHPLPSLLSTLIQGFSTVAPTTLPPLPANRLHGWSGETTHLLPPHALCS